MHDQRVEVVVGENGADHRTRRSRRSPIRAGRPGWRGSPPRDSRRERSSECSRRARGASRPADLAGVGAEDAESAGVRDHADAASARQWLAREQRGRVEQLLERPRAQHARLVEERIDGDVRAREGGGVRACGPRAGRGRARLQREDRFAASDAARDPREGARVSERLEVEQRRGRWRRRPPTTRAGRSRRRRPCSRSTTNAEKPSVALGRLLEQRESERAALRGEADPARRQRARREGRVQAARRAPRSRDSSGRRAARRGRGRARAAAPGARAPSGAGLGEARRDHAERAHARDASAAAAASITCSAGRQITARSTGSGISAIDV